MVEKQSVCETYNMMIRESKNNIWNEVDCQNNLPILSSNKFSRINTFFIRVITRMSLLRIVSVLQERISQRLSMQEYSAMLYRSLHAHQPLQ